MGVDLVLVFKGVVPLGIWHRSAIEPYVNEVGYPFHRFATFTYQYNLIDKWPVKIEDAVVQVIFVHPPTQYFVCLSYTRIQFFYTSQAGFLAAISCSPDGQG